MIVCLHDNGLTVSMQAVHRDPAAAAVLSVSGTLLPDAPQPSGGAGPGSPPGVPLGDGSAPVGPAALPARPADPTLAGPGRPHPQTMQHPGASPGAPRLRPAALLPGNHLLLIRTLTESQLVLIGFL